MTRRRNRAIRFRGDRLKFEREREGWTQWELAEKAGVTRPQLANLETGQSEPSISVLADLAICLGVSTDWLLNIEFEESDE